MSHPSYSPSAGHATQQTVNHAIQVSIDSGGSVSTCADSSDTAHNMLYEASTGMSVVGADEGGPGVVYSGVNLDDDDDEYEWQVFVQGEFSDE